MHSVCHTYKCVNVIRRITNKVLQCYVTFNITFKMCHSLVFFHNTQLYLFSFL
jgi:hypothetical protein